jgi:hypothetical protein
MLSVSERDDVRKVLGCRWIPAFAGMTSPNVPAFAGMTSPNVPAFAGMTSPNVPAFAGMTNPGSRSRETTMGGLQSAISKTTLPAWPDLIAAIAASKSASGNLCVMTGVGSNSPDRRKRVIWIQVSYIFRPTTP